MSCEAASMKMPPEVLENLIAALDQCFRVKAGSLYQIRLADAACVDLCFCIRIGRIVARRIKPRKKILSG